MTTNLMPILVADCAKGDSVGYIKTEFGIVGKRFEVVGVQVAATVIAAILASKLVPNKDIESPALVLSRETLTTTLSRFPVFVRWTLVASAISKAASNADLFSRVERMVFAKHVLVSLATGRHLGETFRRMLAALEGGYAAFRGPWILNPYTVTAFRLLTIVAAIVGAVVGKRMPLLAFGTALQSCVNLCGVLIRSKASLLCGNQHSAMFCLSHSNPYSLS